MRHVLITLLFLATFAGCSRHQEGSNVAAAPAAQSAMMVDGPDQPKYLALAHFLDIETSEEQVPVYFKRVQEACTRAAADGCTLLDTRLSTGRETVANVKLRAKPAGIRAVTAALSKEGQVVNQSTRTEDLAAPIADNAKKLKMLTDYRNKLEAMSKERLDVDALMKLNRELAETQAELEAATGSQAYLMQRVNTETLDVTITASPRISFSAPIRAALNDFGPDLAKGIANTISATAYLVPLALALWIVVALVRKLRARIKRSRAA